MIGIVPSGQPMMTHIRQLGSHPLEGCPATVQRTERSRASSSGARRDILRDSAGDRRIFQRRELPRSRLVKQVLTQPHPNTRSDRGRGLATRERWICIRGHRSVESHEDVGNRRERRRERRRGWDLPLQSASEPNVSLIHALTPGDRKRRLTLQRVRVDHRYVHHRRLDHRGVQLP